MRRILLSTFIALCEAHLPLAEASNLLDYQDRFGLRRTLIASTQNPVARDGLEYIQRLAEKRDSGEFNQTVMGPENRLVDFLACDAIRLMFSTTRDRGDRTLDFLEIMDRGDILLVDLQRGDAVSGPNCKLLGAIILRYLFELMASRKKLPLPKGEHHHPFMVYIDEAHQYLSGDVQGFLTDARKYRLGLTLAHQFVFQLEEAGEAVYHAVRTCTNNKIVFKIQAAEEAQDLAHDVLPLSLETPVEASIRPAQVGSIIGRLRNETRGTQESSSEMGARHHARSTGMTITDTEQRSRGRSQNNSFMRGSGRAALSGAGVSAGTVDAASSMNSLSMGYDPLTQNLMTPNMPLSMNIGAGDGTSHSHIATECSHRSKSVNAFDSQSESDSTSESEGFSTAYSTSIADMEGESHGASVARGASHTQGFSEASLAIYKDLAVSYHSNEHELYFKGEKIRNLPVGRAIARLDQTTFFLNVPPPRKRNSAQGHAPQTALAGLIAKTPAAQPREQIIQRHKTRVQERLQATAKPTPAEDDLIKREPLPMVNEPDQFAEGFFKRLEVREKEKQKPPKRSKPRLLIDNDKPDPSDKK